MLSGIVGIIYAIAVVLVVLWILGFALHILGGAIHILLIIAIVLIAYNLLVGSRRGAL